MAAQKKSSKSNGKGITKSAFIRSLPDRTPAKEVIAKAKEAGLDLTEKHVWTVQSEMRSGTKGGAKKSVKKAAKKATQAISAPAAAASAAPTAPTKSAPAKSMSKKSPKKKAPAKVVAKKAASAESASAEHKMKALIVQLGTMRADELYRAMRKEIDAIVGR
jgi:DNA-binding protein HU-beta